MKLLNSFFSANRAVRLVLICLIAVLLLIVSTTIQQSQQTSRTSSMIAAPPMRPLPIKKVFAHYMVCCPAAGSDASVEDFKQEIREAQRRGIDGFALNCGGWAREHYRDRVIQIYEAARQLGTGFQLLISMDYCCGNNLQDTSDAFELVKNHPNQFRYDGKPVLSTYGGESRNPETGQQKIDLVHTLGGVFVAFFFPASYGEHVTLADLAQLSRDYANLDGYFYFGAAGVGDSIARANRMHANHWLPKGKIFMAGISPYYRSSGRLYETQGFKSMAQEWEGAIRDNATWVQIVTWNDWVEKSYVAPFGTIAETKIWGGTDDGFGPVNYSHVAYLDASRYYIDWFKTGVQPTITDDQLFYFYRPEPKSAAGQHLTRSEIERGIQNIQGAITLQDKLFVTTFLTAPARLTIYSGKKMQAFNLSVGIQHIDMPYELGQQRFVLQRDGKVLIDKVSEFEIKDRAGISQYNYFAGNAEKAVSSKTAVDLNQSN